MVLFEQPTSVTGSTGGVGLGCPNAIQNKNIRDIIVLVTDPVSVAVSVSIPSVKRPRSGPPTTPNIVKPAYNININKIYLSKI